jgi:hypothetical protein
MVRVRFAAPADIDDIVRAGGNSGDAVRPPVEL